MHLTIIGNCGPYPAPGGACSGYLLQQGDTRALLDCGCGVLPRLMEIADPAALSFIALTHLHFDHAGDMLPLSYYLAARGRRLPVYLPMADAPLRDMLQALPVFETRDIALGAFEGALRMETLPVRHPAPAFALRFTAADGARFCYTGDTNVCDGLASFAQGSEALLCDACLTEALWHANAPHLSARLAGELAAKAGVKSLLLTHFNPDISRETLLTEARRAFPAARLTRMGDTEAI